MRRHGFICMNGRWGCTCSSQRTSPSLLGEGDGLPVLLVDKHMGLVISVLLVLKDKEQKKEDLTKVVGFRSHTSRDVS